MTAFFPLAAWFLLFKIFCYRSGLIRESFLRASIIWGLIVVLTTEVLSLFNILRFEALLAVWLLIVLLMLIIFHKQIIWTKDLARQINIKKSSINYISFGGVLLVVVTAGFTGLLAPPNNWDSMTYHMARVMHWIQNQSVEHYPTHILRQLYMNPWAEFAVLHLQILSKGEYLSNLVQWFSMLGSIIGVSLIAKNVGATVKEQWLTALIAVTIPMGVLQGSSTQNDLVLTFWLVCFIYYVTAYIYKYNTEPKIGNKDISLALWLGAGFGLAVLTKGTAYVFALPFIIWLVLVIIKKFKFKSWKLFIIIGIIALAINLGHYARNYTLFGNPLFIPAYEEVRNETFGVGTLFSNMIRNMCLYMSTPFPSLNNQLEKAVYAWHDYFDLNPNNPSTTFYSIPFHVDPGPRFHEDIAGNPIHFILIWIALLSALGMRKIRANQNLMFYMLAVLVAIPVFCMLIKWQPWGTRLQLPLFIIITPCIAMILFKIFSFNEKLIAWVGICLIVSVLPWVFCNESRPLVGRIYIESWFVENLTKHNIVTTPRKDQYFANRPDLKEAYLEASGFVASQKYHDIGIITGTNTWEYPFWVLLKSFSKESLRIEHINVNNETSDLEQSKVFNPQCILFISNQPIGRGWSDVILANHKSYRLTWRNEYFMLYTE